MFSIFSSATPVLIQRQVIVEDTYASYPLQKKTTPPNDCFSMQQPRQHIPSLFPNPFLVHTLLFGGCPPVKDVPLWDVTPLDATEQSLPPEISGLEARILLCLTYDIFNNKDIAGYLHVSESAAKNGISHLYSLFGLNAQRIESRRLALREKALQNPEALAFALKQTPHWGTVKTLIETLPHPDSRFVDAIIPTWDIAPLDKAEQSLPAEMGGIQAGILLCLAHDIFADQDIATCLNSTENTIKGRISSLYSHFGLRIHRKGIGIEGRKTRLELREKALQNPDALVLALKQTPYWDTGKKLIETLPHPDSRFVDAIIPTWDIEPLNKTEQSLPPKVTGLQASILLCLAHDIFTNQDIMTCFNISEDVAQDGISGLYSLFKTKDRNQLREKALQNPRALALALKQTPYWDAGKTLIETFPHPDSRFVDAIIPTWDIAPLDKAEQSLPPEITALQAGILLCLAHDIFDSQDIMTYLHVSESIIMHGISSLYSHFELNTQGIGKGAESRKARLALREKALQNPEALVSALKQTPYWDTAKTLIETLPHPDSRFADTVPATWNITPLDTAEQSLPPGIKGLQAGVLLCLAHNISTEQDIANRLKSSEVSIHAAIQQLYSLFDTKDTSKLREEALKNPKALVFALKQTPYWSTGKTLIETFPHPDSRFVDAFTPTWDIKPLNKTEQSLPPEITGLQASILLCLAHDINNQDIMTCLNIPEKSFKRGISSLYSHFGLNTQGTESKQARLALQKESLQNPLSVIQAIANTKGDQQLRLEQAFRIIMVYPSPNDEYGARFINAIKDTEWFRDIRLLNGSGPSDLREIANTFEMETDARIQGVSPKKTYRDIRDKVFITTERLKELGITYLKDVSDVAMKLGVLTYDETRPIGQRYQLAA